MVHKLGCTYVVYATMHKKALKLIGVTFSKIFLNGYEIRDHLFVEL